MTKIKRISVIVTAIALVCAMGLTFAYFTDRVTNTGSISTTTNAVDVDITKPDDPNTELGNAWAAANATALANFNPGDRLVLDGQINNKGTVAIDYRETFVITSSVAMSKTAPEFRLFADSTQATNGAYTGKSVIATESISADGKTITYTIAPATLAVGASAKPTYDLVFDLLAGNSFQGATGTVYYMVEARQADAAGADAAWTTVATESITFGGQNVNAVPVAP